MLGQEWPRRCALSNGPSDSSSGDGRRSLRRYDVRQLLLTATAMLSYFSDAALIAASSTAIRCAVGAGHRQRHVIDLFRNALEP